MRHLLWVMPCTAVLACMGLLAVTNLSEARNNVAAEADLTPSVELPIGRAVLFNSGVGYFQREGWVTDEARVDLSFHERDVNDLLKSMVLMDDGGGTVAAVSYDSTEPVERTLESFAVNLNGEPNMGAILSQARGEKVEVVLNQTAVNQPANLTGSIVGVETKPFPIENTIVNEAVLNLWCSDGIRSVKLSDVQRLRFANPKLEEEFRRALEVLSEKNDRQDKSVTVRFAGEGRRKVKVGYVVEHPIWKTSYRLVLDGKDAEPPVLQGWAMVENPTDEDWAGVQMALISGRPISFRMDLYDPLYVQRPMVEPELFASLRPPTYQRDLSGKDKAADGALQATQSNRRRASNGMFTDGYDRAEKATAGEGKGDSYRGLAAPMAADPEMRKQAEELGRSLNERMDLGGVASAATASQLGDYFQYVIDRPVDLPRQKSAMLPIVANAPVEAKRVSIYNPSVQATHPLLGLRLKNSTKMHLTQGPVTVFEGSVYAGDTRWLDLQPNEERLVSYAIDLGTEVDPKNGKNTSRITKVRAVKGVVHTTTQVEEERVYTIRNASEQDRVVLIEHPNRKGQQFEVVSDTKPVEETADFHRFEVDVPADQTKALSVLERRDVSSQVVLSNSQDNQIRYFVNLAQASPELKQALSKALQMKGKWDGTRRDITEVQNRINTITQDQNRLRQNLREVPRDSDAYKRYLEKFDEQEEEMDTLHAKLKSLQQQEHTHKVAYEDYLKNLSVE